MLLFIVACAARATFEGHLLAEINLGPAFREKVNFKPLNYRNAAFTGMRSNVVMKFLKSFNRNLNMCTFSLCG